MTSEGMAMQDLNDEGFDDDVAALEREWLNSEASEEWFAQEQQFMAIAHQQSNRQIAMVGLIAVILFVALLISISML